jgi:asparagine synthase (glutamine-hydrolysing)
VEKNWTRLFNTLADDIASDSLAGGIRRLARAIGVITLPNFAVEQIKKIINSKAATSNQHPWLLKHLQAELKQRIESQPTLNEKKLGLPGQRHELSLLQDAYLIKNHLINERYVAAFGIETRRPYSSKAMIQLSFMLPKRLKHQGGLNKYIHRQALRELLPNDVLSRTTKAKFSVTFDYYTEHLRAALETESLSTGHAWISRSYVNRYFEVYEDDEMHYEVPWVLWNLLFCDIIISDKTSDTTS